MGKPHVLITCYYLDPGDEIDQYVQSAGIETVFSRWHGGRTEEEMIELLPGVDGVLAGSDPYTARVLEAADRLKVIARAGVGYEKVDVKAASARNIAVCNTAGANRHAVAEWAIALMLVCARKGLANLSEIRNGGWSRHEGVDLAGKTLGIIGLGTIGKEVAKRMRAFEMRVLAYDVRQDQQFADEHQVSYLSVEQLLRESDVVTIHTFLDARTKHLINAERLALMKPTAYLINTARGSIVDTEALYEALRDKRIAAAALDVFEEEPLSPDSPLRHLDNLYTSPHVGGSSREARDLASRTAADDLLRVLRGERPLYPVNPQVFNEQP